MQDGTPFWRKSLTLLGCILLGALIGQSALMAMAYFHGIELTSKEAVMGMMSDPNLANNVKIFIGFNHILTFIAGPLLYLNIVYGNKWKNFLHLKHFDPILLLLFPIALFSLYPLMGYIGELIGKLPLPEFLDGMDKSSMEVLAGLLKMDSFGALVINLFIVGVLPGIGEELLFRGIIQKEIQKKWFNPHLAIWITAFIFSAVHMQIAGLIPKMMIGALLGYAYFYSGSLILPMILHCLNNSTATIALYFMGSNINVDNLDKEESIPIASVVISTAIFIGVWMYIKQVLKTLPPDKLIKKDIA